MKHILYILLFVASFTLTSCDNNLSQNQEISPKVASIIRQIKANKNKEAINAILTLDNNEYQTLTNYFQNNLPSLIPPYLFMLSNAVIDINKQQATYYYLLARLRLMEDIDKCNDQTSGADIFMFIGKIAPKPITYVSTEATSDELKKATESAINFDVKNPNKLSPMWICTHGVGAFSSGGVQLASESSWPDIYKKEQSKLQKTIDNTIKRKHLSK